MNETKLDKIHRLLWKAETSYTIRYSTYAFTRRCNVEYLHKWKCQFMITDLLKHSFSYCHCHEKTFYVSSYAFITLLHE